MDEVACSEVDREQTTVGFGIVRPEVVIQGQALKRTVLTALRESHHGVVTDEAQLAQIARQNVSGSNVPLYRFTRPKCPVPESNSQS